MGYSALTRSVTIERKGGGGVLRRDSGWQAQSPGIFDFTTDDAPTQPFEIHPGLIRGIFNASRIRPLANEGIDLPGGKVLPMAFDADVALDGRIGGGLTPAKGLIGYLHLEPLGAPISPAALAALIANQGPTGGPVDDMIDVGGSGFTALVPAYRGRCGASAGAGPGRSGVCRRGPDDPAVQLSGLLGRRAGLPARRAGAACTKPASSTARRSSAKARQIHRPTVLSRRQ